MEEMRSGKQVGKGAGLLCSLLVCHLHNTSKIFTNQEAPQTPLVRTVMEDLLHRHDELNHCFWVTELIFQPCFLCLKVRGMGEGWEMLQGRTIEIPNLLVIWLVPR